jgi:hypothetical protein
MPGTGTHEGHAGVDGGVPFVPYPAVRTHDLGRRDDADRRRVGVTPLFVVSRRGRPRRPDTARSGRGTAAPPSPHTSRHDGEAGPHAQSGVQLVPPSMPYRYRCR